MALHRFISKLAKKCLPSSFKKLRKVSAFEWTEECEKAFQDLKKYLQSPQVLSRLVEEEELFVYLSTYDQAVSAMLIREEDKIQKLVYYISRVLQGPELRYASIIKLAFALLIAVRKFREYGYLLLLLLLHRKVKTNTPLR